MNHGTLRHLIILLLTLTGIFHLAVAMLGMAPGLALPLSGFGALYIGIGFFVRRDTNDGSKSHSRNAVIAAVAACTVGLLLGGNSYLANQGPGVLIPMFLIDVAIIGAGLLWLSGALKKKKH